MKITHDREADAIHIKLNDNMFASDKIITDSFILNMDSNGQVMGIEILHASKLVTDPSHIDFEDITRSVDEVAS